jgi:hypothetical protein
MRGVDTFLAIKSQTNLFTPRVVGDFISGDFLAFNNESLSGRQQVISSPAIRRQAMRGVAYSASGTMASEGSIEFTATNIVLNKLLELMFHSGSGTVTTPTGRIYTLTAGGALTPFTSFVGFSGAEGIYARRFSGCKLNRATFSSRVDSMLTVNADIAAINKELLTGAAATATPLYPAASAEFPYIFSNASVLFKSGTMANLGEIPVESFDLTVNHNLAVDKYRLGSVFRRSLQEGVTDVEGSFTLDASAQSLNANKFELTGGVTDDPAFFERIAREGRYCALTFQVSEPTREVTAGNPAFLRIELPFARLEEPDFNVRDGSVITGTARFTAYDSITVTHSALLT